MMHVCVCVNWHNPHVVSQKRSSQTAGGWCAVWCHVWHFQHHTRCRWPRCGYSRCLNLGGLSLTSVRVIRTWVVPDSPPMWPPMSLAWMTTSYSWRASRSMFGKAVRMIPDSRHFKLNNAEVALPAAPLVVQSVCKLCTLWTWLQNAVWRIFFYGNWELWLHISKCLTWKAEPIGKQKLKMWFTFPRVGLIYFQISHFARKRIITPRPH